MPVLKACAHCGKEMPRKLYGPDLIPEAWTKYSKRHTCGVACSSMRRRIGDEEKRARKREREKKRMASPEKRERKASKNKERIALQGETFYERQRASSRKYLSKPENLSAARAASLDYYRRNKELVAFKIAAKKYSIPIDQLRELVKRTECESCGARDPGEKGRTWPLHIDHDHATGRFRGMLCSGCNLALGNVKDSPERLRALAAYIEARHA